MVENTRVITSGTIRELRDKVIACLHACDVNIQTKAKRFEEEGEKFCTWNLALDRKREEVHQETCAIAAGIAILMNCQGEEAKGTAFVTEAVNLLRKTQQDDWGWTSTPPPPGQKGDSLVLDTCYALSSLLKAGEDVSSETVRRAIDWIIKAVNPKGGWGFLSFAYPQRDPNSYVLPTCYAIRALCLACDPRDIVVRDIMDRAYHWLKDECRRSTGAYGPRSEGESESAIHTAAVIMAFLAMGRSPYSLDIRESMNWLLNNLNERKFSEESNYEVPPRDQTGQIIPGYVGRSISHVTFPEGFLLQGLIEAKANLLEPKLLELVEYLVDTEDNSSWQCPNRPPEQRPIYAVMDACLALHAFLTEVDSKGNILDLIVDLRNLELRIGKSEEQINSISEEIKEVKQRTAILSPLSTLIRSVTRYWLFYVAGVLFGVTGFGAFNFPDKTHAIYSGALATIALIIELYNIYSHKRKEAKGEG